MRLLNDWKGLTGAGGIDREHLHRLPPPPPVTSAVNDLPQPCPCSAVFAGGIVVFSKAATIAKAGGGVAAKGLGLLAGGSAVAVAATQGGGGGAGAGAQEQQQQQQQQQQALQQAAYRLPSQAPPPKT